jgi:PhnB protein
VASIAPWLSVRNAAEALTYHRAAFDAIELERLEDESGDLAVAQLALEGADFWIQADPESSPNERDRNSVRMILTVDDPGSVFERALAAGGTEVSPVAEGYGWLVGRLVDPFGHHWEVGRRLTP